MRHFILLSDGVHMDKQKSSKHISSKKLVYAIRSVMFGLCMSSMVIVHAEQQTSQAYNVAAGTLGSALSSFAIQSGVALSFDPALTRGLKSVGLKGSYSFEQAKNKLMQGTGLALVQNKQGSWMVIRPTKTEILPSSENLSSTVLPVINTEAESSNLQQNKRTQLSKLGLKIQQTPQTISVVDQEQIQSQNLQTVSQALNQVAGVTAISYGDGTSYFQSRGYATDVQFDGLPASDGLQYMTQFDLNYYDRVEVQRGASGILSGFGNPGATVNLVRKKPTADFQVNGTVGIGSWNNAFIALDTSGSLNNDQTIRGRAGVSVQDKDSFVDQINNQHGLFYGALSGDIDENTTITLGGAYQKNHTNGVDYGVSLKLLSLNPVAVEPVSASRSTFYGTPWSFADDELYEIYTSLEHKWNENWSSEIAANYRNIDSKSLYGNFWNPISMNDLGNYHIQSQNLKTEWTSFDASIKGQFDWFGLPQSLVLGSNYDRRNQDSYSGGESLGYIDIFSTSAVPYTDVPYDYATEATTEQYSVYGQFLLKPFEPLGIILGGRQSWYSNTKSGILPVATAKETYPDINKFSPYVALTYDLSKSTTAYISYNNIFSPPQAWQTTVDGNLLQAREGEQYEVGLKTQLNAQLGLDIALYQLNDKNRPLADTTHPNFWISTGEAKTRGIDLQLQGKLNSLWKINTGYTYLDSQLTKTEAELKNQDTEEPRHQFKLWTTYNLPFINSYDGTYIGLGLRSQSKTTRSDGAYWQDPYTVADLLFGYQLDNNLKLSLNINNVFDKKYYDRLPAQYYSVYGQPRNVLLSLNFNY